MDEPAATTGLTLPAQECCHHCAAVSMLTSSRLALHSLTQPVAVIVGAVELLALHPEGSPRRAVLLNDLAEAAECLMERTEQLRAALHAED